MQCVFSELLAYCDGQALPLHAAQQQAVRGVAYHHGRYTTNDRAFSDSAGDEICLTRCPVSQDAGI